MSDTKFSNPAPLGLIGFGMTTWMLSMMNAGWFDGKNMGMVLALAFTFGGFAQIVAGIMELPRGNTFGTTAFFSYGAFWWSFALFVHFFGAGVSGAFIGWYLFMWGLFTFYMWIATFPAPKALQLVFLALWITFLLLAVHAWSGKAVFGVAGGYVGLLTAVFAIYLSAAEVINEQFGRTVLPVGAKG